MSTLQSPTGTFIGKPSVNVTQYLGIPYATSKDQLSPPEIILHYDDVVDATEYGPRAPATDASLFEQQVLIQHVVDTSPSPRMSGTECLNLNITVPSLGPEAKKDLPVMVFFHGGGFIMGSNAAPHFEPSRFVKLSVEIRSPVIVVSINYRLALLGNLTSAELRAAGYPGNNALRDQKCALQWVERHIGGFGGDAGNVTAFGVSAGSVALLMQLFSSERLFKRAIAMSGTPLMLKPVTSSDAESTYDAIIAAFGLENASVEERIKRLISIAPDELVAKTPMTARLAPFLDGVVLHDAVTFESLAKGLDTPGSKWCEELMIGDCQHDGNVFHFMGLAARSQDLANHIYTSFSATLGVEVATAVLEAYGITPATPGAVAMNSVVSLATDIAYAAPTLSFARAWPGKRYVYHFDQGNPWEGQFKGMATHMLDAAFLFQQYNDSMGEKERSVARALGKGFIAFANGSAPWEEFDGKDGSVKIFGEDETERVVVNNGWADGRRDTLFGFAKEGVIELDQLSEAWNLFLTGR